MRLIKHSFNLALLVYSVTVVKAQECNVSSIDRSGNLDVSRLKNTVGVGDSIRVNCHIGYVGFKRFKCTETGWEASGRGCELKPCGHPGDTQNGDFTLSEREDFVFGAEVTYTCNEGFQMASRRPTRTCLAGGWDNVVPTCEVVKCPTIQVDNEMSVLGDFEDANFGDVIRFECRSQNLMIVGSSEINCNSEGKWSSAIPRCEEITCPEPTIDKGRVTSHKEKYKKEDTLRYECDRKYKRDERHPKCTKTGWVPQPYCEAIMCKISLSSSVGTSTEPRGQNLFTPGDFVTVICGHGYWTKSYKKDSDQIRCKEDGEWESLPVCEVITCGVPWLNAVYNLEWDFRHSFAVNSTVSYRCTDGYKKNNNAKKATCHKDGWHPKPLCEEILCSVPSIPNVVFKKQQNHYKWNEGLAYECSPGYTPKWQRVIYCNENGWTQTHTCTAAADACVQPVLENGFQEMMSEDTWTSTVHYSCNKDHKPLTGGWWGRATCTEGSWSAEPTCIQKEQCGSPPAILHADVQSTKVFHANRDRVTVECEAGYEATGDLICMDGDWRSLVSPVCKPSPEVVRRGLCDLPPEVENAVLLKPSRYHRKYRVGSEVTYECRESFAIEGQRQLTCTDGEWGKPPKCISIECPNPEKKIKNAILESRVKSNAIYRCEEGFTSPNTIATCTNRTWKYPECTASSPHLGNQFCEKPNLEFMQLNPEKPQYDNEETLGYICLDPYTKTPGGNVTCIDGEWRGELECTSDSCPPPPLVKNGNYSIEKKNVKGVITKVSYTCELNYTASHSAIECKRNEWTVNPSCYGPCQIFKPDPQFNLKDLTHPVTLQHDEDTNIPCKEGYQYVENVVLNRVKKSVTVECRRGQAIYKACEEIDPSLRPTARR